jgi:Raf kinase inhibitor-like YbhB/YbcL family protein
VNANNILGDIMKLTSKDFTHNSYIPSEFTIDGRNVSPQLSWTDAPEETESYALAVTDPDAVGGWNHWLVYEISKNVNEINQNSLPAGAKEVENDFGRKRYGGPSPPSGTHRYFFTLYALDVVHLDGVSSRNFFDKIEKHALAKAELVGLYKRRR